MNRYLYSGPVVEFGTCVANCWKASTYAPSEAKARCNFKYQYKMKNNKNAGTKIELPGKIIME